MNPDNIKHLVGEFFNGQYEVKKFLGEGSFAKVYLVKHNYLEDLRAMKIIKQPISQTTNLKSVFQEVMIATKLRHENIISIYDAGIMSDFSENNQNDGKAYFVMEYVRGGNLEQYLNSFIKSNIFMPIKRALDLIKQILSGLNVLHMSNPQIVHRDLKLNNILLTYDACGEILVKISDFGFAKEVTTNISDIDIVGTRPYMAPESFIKSISVMTDIYAVGVIFYQLLTNVFPYDVENFTIEECLDLKPWKCQLKPPSFYNKNVSKNLDNIVMKCLETDPKDRYQNVSELLNDVEVAFNKLKPLICEKNQVYLDDYYNYPLNDSLKKAFLIAKKENKLNEAIEILEREVLKDYDVRKYYGETLKMWKSQYPDVKLISNAFTVNLTGKNYKLSCDLLKEAIAYNPLNKHKFAHFIDLWELFIDLTEDGNLVKSVLHLEELMETNRHIKKIYSPIINTLKLYSIEEIIAKAIQLVDSNNLVDASNLMEFAVVLNSEARQKYEYKLSLWKQNMNSEFKCENQLNGDTIDYAIDLGTTDSVLSYFNDGNPIIVKNYNTGDNFTPSAVFIDDNNEVHVGEVAKKLLMLNDNVVSEFKHNMGFSIPFNFQNASRAMHPEELSAEILKDLRVSLYKQSGVNMEHAVICVPANSNYIKTKAINDAANLAGFRSHSLLSEPLAVAIAYELKSFENSNWIIYDLGGGTLSISLIRFGFGEIKNVESIRWDDFGGNSFDWAIVDELFVPKIVKELQLIDFRRDNLKYKKIFSKLKSVAENSKKELSDFISTDICINNLFSNYNFTFTLTRDMFAQIIKPLMKSTFNLVQHLLDENLMTENQVNKIILVGGTCKSPIVQKLIADNFEIPLEYSIDPLTVVAKGASIYAGNLKKPNVDIENNTVSLIVNIEKDCIYGKAYGLDDKLSFLGYSIEFVNDDYSSQTIPLTLDGEFKITIPNGEYEINIYNEDNRVLIDEKSPNRINDDKFHIRFFNKSFSKFDALTWDELTDSYNGMIKDIDYLNNHFYSFGETEILEYLDRLIDLVQIDKMALIQASIYMKYLKDIVDEQMNNLKFSVLLENIENKMDIVKSNNLFNISDLEDKLNTARDLKDYNQLNEIYNRLIKNYIRLNRHDVIISCYFNLKSEGIYINNFEIFEKLCKKASVMLNNHDYDELIKIICKLYELDERFDGM